MLRDKEEGCWSFTKREAEATSNAPHTYKHTREKEDGGGGICIVDLLLLRFAF
jgi:hypothetical protein